MTTQEVEVTAFVCQTNPNMENTPTVLKVLEPYTAPSMKWAPSILSNKISTIMMLPVSCVMSGHVAPRWWYPQGMTVLIVGPKSIMGTWWLYTGVIKTLKIISVLTGKLSRFQEVSPAMMVHYCTWFRQIVDISQDVHLITRVESSHAQCAQNNFVVKMISSVYRTYQLVYRCTKRKKKITPEVKMYLQMLSIK